MAYNTLLTMAYYISNAAYQTTEYLLSVQVKKTELKRSLNLFPCTWYFSTHIQSFVNRSTYVRSAKELLLCRLV